MGGHRHHFAWVGSRMMFSTSRGPLRLTGAFSTIIGGTIVWTRQQVPSELIRIVLSHCQTTPVVTTYIRKRAILTPQLTDNRIPKSLKLLSLS